MAKANNNLSFDDGLTSFTINGDKNRVIRFNPGDPNLLQRYYQAIKNIDTVKAKIGDDIILTPTGEAEETDDAGMVAAALKEVDNVIRENLNFMLDADVYDTIFGNQSPLCIVGKGEYLFEAVLNCIGPIIKDAVSAAAAASEKRKNKYLKGFKK